MNQSVKTPSYITPLAKDLLNNMTGSEEKMWSILKMKQIGGYKSDAIIMYIDVSLIFTAIKSVLRLKIKMC